MKLFAKIAFAAVLGVVSIPALSVVAPATMTEAQACGTGGTTTNYKHCHKPYLQTCRELGYAGPCGLGGVRAGHGGYGHAGAHRPVYYGHRPVRRPVPVYAANGHYRSGAVYGSSSSLVIPRARNARPAAPPPSPEQVARIAKHKVERVAVDCADTYSRVEGSNRCARITWVPGED